MKQPLSAWLRLLALSLVGVGASLSCSSGGSSVAGISSPEGAPADAGAPDQTPSGQATLVDLYPDKARFPPGEMVTLTAVVQPEGTEPFRGPMTVSFYHLDEVIHEETVWVEVEPVVSEGEDAEPVREEVELTWQPPTEDFIGYLAIARLGSPESSRSTAIDVSSTPFRFPRYGFISQFTPGQEATVSAEELQTLAREFHLNMLQFYDWFWRHDQFFLRGPDGEIAETWTDLFGRVQSWSVILDLIDASHEVNVAAMAYVMIYAAREGYQELFDIDPAWGMYATPFAVNQLDVQFFNGTALYLFDPANEAWQDWMIDQYIQAIDLGGFDGVHIDQLGPRYGVHTFDGRLLEVPDTFPPFLEEVDRRLTENDPERAACTYNIVDGEVNGWAVEEVATSPACDFLYSELWFEANTYEDLRRYIEQLRELGGGRAVVLAAYSQYNEQVGPIREAEGAQLAGLDLSDVHPGFTGTGFAANFDAVGDSITWEVEVPEATPITFVVRAANASGVVATRTLYIDDVPVGRLFFSRHDQWSTWSSDAWIQRQLGPGVHRIRLSYDAEDVGAINVDHLRLGEFDEDSVRLQNAAMFASGATHIQLGDDVQALAHEYYPNRQLSLTPSARRALRRYYTFMTAYENLLFDTDVVAVDGGFDRLGLEGANLIRQGADGVWPVVRQAPGFEVVHLLNLVGLEDDLWRDEEPTPVFLDNLTLRYYLPDPGAIEGAFFATPDFDGSGPRNLEVTRGGDDRGTFVQVTVPRLEYWDMVVFRRAEPDGLQ